MGLEGQYLQILQSLHNYQRVIAVPLFQGIPRRIYIAVRLSGLRMERNKYRLLCSFLKNRQRDSLVAEGLKLSHHGKSHYFGIVFDICG